jgi:hypothetical protein
VHADPHTTHGLPGSRAPHLWLQRDSLRISTIDLTGRYLLLAGSAGAEWKRAAATAAAQLNRLPLEAYCVGQDLGDPERQFAAAFGVSEAGATLVRPDGFVAWRSVGSSRTPELELTQALRSSLSL